jgi:hypothetical protein
MRISSLIAVLMVGFLTLTDVSLAKPILDFQHESVFRSKFCRDHGCRFINSSGVHTDGIDYDQYLYKLQNSLYFVAARHLNPNPDIRGYESVGSVSLMARATPKNLKRLEAFLPEFIRETAFGHQIDFRYNFKQKCARAAQIDYRGGGLFESIILPGARTLTTLGGQILVSDHKTLTIACIPQSFNMLSITLYWGVIGAWIDNSFGFRCSDPTWTFAPVCPWTPLAQPRRIF